MTHKRRRPVQRDAETASLNQPPPKKRKITRYQAKATAVEQLSSPPCQRTRITLRLRQGRYGGLNDTGRAKRSAAGRDARCGGLDQDDTAKKEAIRQDWLRRLRPRPTRAE
jgi:hypothetical protein